LFFGGFDLAVRSFVKVRDVVRVQRRQGRHYRSDGTALQKLHFAQAAFQPFLSPAQ
jgi:hypothetical protein